MDETSSAASISMQPGSAGGKGAWNYSDCFLSMAQTPTYFVDAAERQIGEAA